MLVRSYKHNYPPIEGGDQRRSEDLYQHLYSIRAFHGAMAFRKGHG